MDDHPLTRHGMAQLINQQSGLEVCAEASCAAEALTAVAETRPDLVLLDMTLPGAHGLELIKDLKALYPDLLMLVVSMHDENVYAERAMRAGARGYLMKNEGGDKLLEAIRLVLSGEPYLSQVMSSTIMQVFSVHPQANDSTVGSFTDREFEVFEWLSRGLTTRQIGQRLHLSPKTVETHRLKLRKKLGLKTSAQLVHCAVRWATAEQFKNCETKG